MKKIAFEQLMLKYLEIHNIKFVFSSCPFGKSYASGLHRAYVVSDTKAQLIKDDFLIDDGEVIYHLPVHPKYNQNELIDFYILSLPATFGLYSHCPTALSARTIRQMHC